jgi:cyclopropane-fatty-acyl-phospholipid synthase
MQYSCGYWANADNLEKAQIDKMNFIARKLDLKPGMRVLDLGCGWGTVCKYLAQNYGVECIGVTISKEGYLYGKEVCNGWPVEILIGSSSYSVEL